MLCSRAHALLSGTVAVLRYDGHRSGRTFHIPVRYAELGDDRLVAIAVREGSLGVEFLVRRAAAEILLEVGSREDVSLVAIGLVERGVEVRLSIAHDRIPAAYRPPDPASECPRLARLAECLEARGGSLVVDTRAGLGGRYTAIVPADEGAQRFA